MNAQPQNQQIATFAGGCFWCTEAIFKRLKGVISVMPGYANGKTAATDYEKVHMGSGHAEAIQIAFDPQIISFQELCEVFFGTHDPTTANRQGYDVGEEYRSAIFFHDESQRQMAEKVKADFEAQKIFAAPIVTIIEPLRNFSAAEQEQIDFYGNNPNQPYCQIVIDPKIAKLRKKFINLLKSDYVT